MTNPALIAAAPIVATMFDQLRVAVASVLAGGDPAAIGVKAVAELPVLVGQFEMETLKLAPAEIGVVATTLDARLKALADHWHSIANQALPAAGPPPA